MKKILIIGKKSFLGSNLKIYLSNFFEVDNFSYEKTFNQKESFFDKYSHVINTAIHKEYIRKEYNHSYDLDKSFIEKFKNIKFFYIFLNSRKIYSPNFNLTERSTLKPRDIYAKNKLTTEKYLKKRIKKKLISLRISNIIGKRIKKNSRTHHKLFLDNLITYRKSKRLIKINNDFKDFISIKQFCLIIESIIKKEIIGIYNVSLSQKVFISEIVKWIDNNFYKKIIFTNIQSDSFTLSNKKLIAKINLKISKNDLKVYCKSIFN